MLGVLGRFVSYGLNFGVRGEGTLLFRLALMLAQLALLLCPLLPLLLFVDLELRADREAE